MTLIERQRAKTVLMKVKFDSKNLQWVQFEGLNFENNLKNKKREKLQKKT